MGLTAILRRKSKSHVSWEWKWREKYKVLFWNRLTFMLFRESGSFSIRLITSFWTTGGPNYFIWEKALRARLSLCLLNKFFFVWGGGGGTQFLPRSKVAGPLMQGVQMRRLSIVVVAHRDGNIDILKAYLVVVFKYYYLKWCENYDLKNVMKIGV